MIWRTYIAHQVYSATKVKKTITIARVKADLVTSGSKKKVEIRSLLIHPDRRVIAAYRNLNTKGKVVVNRYVKNRMYALYKLRK
jgi:hypothetical protein